MTIYNQVELVTPIQDPRVREGLVDFLNRSFADNTSAWQLEPTATGRGGARTAGRATSRAS